MYAGLCSTLLLCLISGPLYAAGGIDVRSQESALRAADAAWAAAAASGNVDEILSYWADDAINYFPGMPAARGKAAIAALVRNNRDSDRGFSLSWKATEVRVAESGELGYTSGLFEMAVTLSSGEVTRRHGHYLCIWRKGEDGKWRCIIETSVFEPDGLADTAGVGLQTGR